MPCETTVIGNRIVARLSGELDHHVAAGIREELDELIDASRAKELAVDLSGVVFMDSSGLGVLLGRYRKMSERGGRMSVGGATRHVERILRMAGIYAIMDKEDIDGGVK